MSDFMYTVESVLSAADAAQKVQDAAKAEKFGVINVLNLKQIMAGKGVEFDGEAVVVEICEPNYARRFLDADPATATCLPCRVSVTRKDGVTRVSAAMPGPMFRLFENEALNGPADEVEAVVRRVVEAARS